MRAGLRPTASLAATGDSNAHSIGIEFEDGYKKYMHLGDPDRILEDASPCMAANGVDPEKARGLVIKTFGS